MISNTTASSVSRSTLSIPDAELYYEVRGSGPLVVLVGAPMDADSFAPLAELLASDHTVLTTDPRGINRSRLRGVGSAPEQRADDLARLIRHVHAGPATGGGQLCERTSTALAAGLGIEPTRFPGDHTGFAADPEPFAVVLRKVLPR